MSNRHLRYSTPTVSYADRQDYRPRVWTPGIQSPVSYRSNRALLFADERAGYGRGFAVSAADIRLMASWLRGKL